jgi:hypothetical protein
MNKNRNVKIYIIATAMLLLIADTLKAQATLEPLRFNSSLYNRSAGDPVSEMSVLAITDSTPVGLPFFDDFAGQVYRNDPFPDTAKWVQGGGTFINNSNPVEPPSYNVATFDGLKDNGTPYTFTSGNIVGTTDILTSRPIKLDTLNPAQANAVFLSFYWQAGGRSSQLEPNDAEDSLYIEFKDAENNWHWAWSVAGQSNGLFRQAIIQVPPAFLGPNFQFRFVSYGQMNGNFDIWHVDYIYLNSGRHAGDTLFTNREEFAVSRKPENFLKGYTAIPFRQFQAAPARITLDSINTYVNLLGASITPFRYEATLSENISNTNLAYYSNIPFPNPVTPSNYARQLRYTIPVDDALLRTSVQQESEIEYKFFVTEQPQPAFSFLLHNDTARTVVHLKDYYAFDDGSAELSFSIGGDYGQAAVKYHTYRPDTISHISMHFTKMVDDVQSQPFSIVVWKYLNGVNGQTKDSILGRVDAAVNYTSEINGYTEYKLSAPVPVSDTFYIGWQQTQGRSRAISVGYDLNSTAKDKIYQDFSGNWQALQEGAPEGALMIRPIFKKELVASSNRTLRNLEVNIYPNPANDLVNIKGEVEKVLVYDVAGKLLISQQYNGEQEKQLETSGLRPGIYILHLFNRQNQSATRKLVISKN